MYIYMAYYLWQILYDVFLRPIMIDLGVESNH
jgi:hypothetical protein